MIKNGKLIALMQDYDETMSDLPVDPKSRYDGGTLLEHCRWLCQNITEICSSLPTDEKISSSVSLKLGFVQGIMSYANVFTIEQLEAHITNE